MHLFSLNIQNDYQKVIQSFHVMLSYKIKHCSIRSGIILLLIKKYSFIVKKTKVKIWVDLLRHNYLSFEVHKLQANEAYKSSIWGTLIK